MNAGLREFDKRPSREDAEALVRRRIDASNLRYRKDMYGLAGTDKLADHFELVHVVRTETPMHDGGRPYLVHEWGVKVNGHRAGSISSSYGGSRHKLLPYGYNGEEVPDA